MTGKKKLIAFTNLSKQNEEHNATGSHSGFEPEAEKSPVPAGSGDSSTSPNGVSRSIASNEPEEERAISFWGALKIPVSLTYKHLLILDFEYCRP